MLDLYAKLRESVNTDMVFDNSELASLMEGKAEDLDNRDLAEFISDLNFRIAECSECGAGKEIYGTLVERRDALVAESDRRVSEGRIPSTKDTEEKKIKALTEEEEEQPKQEQEEPAPEPQPEPEPEPVAEPTPAAPAAPDPAVGGEAEDFVQNLSAAKEHFEKGNLKVADELLKLVMDQLKSFKEQIKAARDAQKAEKEAEQAAKNTAEPEKGKKEDEKKEKANEALNQDQKFTVVARGISDEDVAKKIAQDKQGVAVADEQDKDKFMVIVKEQFSAEDVTKIVANEKSKLRDEVMAEAVEIMKESLEKKNKESTETVSEGFQELLSGLAKIAGKDVKTLEKSWNAISEKNQNITESVTELLKMKELELTNQKLEMFNKLTKGATE